jgi:hypothetical protein
MDRHGTVTALRNEPAGTFICRFSMSQPGCLVLTCKAPGHPNADADGLVHAIIRIEDLFERRVDTWIRDFPGATHVLDVYKGKRVDKRKVGGWRGGRRGRGALGARTPGLCSYVQPSPPPAQPRRAGGLCLTPPPLHAPPLPHHPTPQRCLPPTTRACAPSTRSTT